jgi:hypothetical protein
MSPRLPRLRRRGVPSSPWAALSGSFPPAAPTGPRILCATSVGGHPVAATIDAIVAAALRLRGADPAFLLCDGMLPACELCTYIAFPNPQRFVRNGPQDRLCGTCFAQGSGEYAPLPMPVHTYSRLLEGRAPTDFLAQTAAWPVDECFSFERDGLALGEQARASTLRFFGKADLTTESPELVAATARRYAAGALAAAAVGAAAIDRLEPDVVVCHHGVYVPQGVLGEVARSRGVRVVNWGPSYRDRTVIYSHGDTYHRTFLDEPEAAWNLPLSDTQETELMQFLAERRRGKGDWTWVTPEAALRPDEQEEHHLAETLGLDLSRPTYGLLTNVLWDAQLYYEGHAFEHMLEWLYFTIDHFARRPERQLIVRIHPHEIKAGNRQPVGPELRRRYPELPPNVFVVQHDSPLNTYALMNLCRAVLIYGTKTGVELTPLGQPVVVAADAWIRGKGLTVDVSTKQSYEMVLDGLEAIEPLDAETVTRARRYAYHYFFRRMIPVRSLAPAAREVRLDVGSLQDLEPGRDPGLDVICDGIMHGSPFVFDA